MGAVRLTSSRTTTGGTGSLPRTLIPRSISLTGTWTILESRRSSCSLAAQVIGRSAGCSSTAVPGRLITSGRPFTSTIWPRGASTRIERIWLSSAACRYCGPDSTCSAQSRKKRTPNASSATAPRIPILSASCGMKRYGLSTRGSGGRKRSEPERWPREPLLAKEPYLRRGLDRPGQSEEPPRERVDRQRLEQHRPGRDLVAEQVVQDQRAELDEDRRDRDRHVRRVATVAARGLAVAADPVAGDREQQRGDAERGEVGRVDDQAGEEAGARAVDRAAQQRDRDQRQQHHVGVAAQNVDLAEDRHLEDRRHEHQQRDLGGLEQAGPHGWFRFFGTSTSTECSES